MNEEDRLKAVKDLAILDTPVEARFDRITKLAIKLFDVPISTLTIMDSDREWFKSCRGVDVKESPRLISFCGHVVASEDEILVIEDTKLDPRFADNPMVVGAPFIRFYAGVPIFSLSGERIGVMCVKDIKPRHFTESQKFMLETLASWADLEVNIVGVKKILAGNGDRDKLMPLFDRLKQRDVAENLKAIKFGLNLKLGGGDVKDVVENEEAINQVEELILEIRKAIGS